MEVTLSFLNSVPYFHRDGIIASIPQQISATTEREKINGIE